MVGKTAEGGNRFDFSRQGCFQRKAMNGCRLDQFVFFTSRLTSVEIQYSSPFGINSGTRDSILFSMSASLFID